MFHSQPDRALSRARSTLPESQPGFPEAGSETEFACRMFLREWPLNQVLWTKHQGLSRGKPSRDAQRPPCASPMGVLEPELLSGVIPCPTSVLLNPSGTEPLGCTRKLRSWDRWLPAAEAIPEGTDSDWPSSSWGNKCFTKGDWRGPLQCPPHSGHN